jgi:hypothetical protein
LTPASRAPAIITAGTIVTSTQIQLTGSSRPVTVPRVITVKNPKMAQNITSRKIRS